MSFSRYPGSRESGIEWLGEIPSHWEAIQLKRVIASVTSGTSVNAADVQADEGELGVLKTSCVYEGWFDWRKNKTVNVEEKERVSCPVRVGTLIVSRMNTPDLVGAAGLVDYAPEGIFLPDRLWQVDFINLAFPRFVFYFSNSLIYRRQVMMACAGTSSSMQNLGQDEFGSIWFSCPPRQEQELIAAFLDHETAKIDALIAEQQRLIELLKEKRQAVISHAVTKGLNPNTPMKDSGVEWLGEVPAHWKVSRLRWYSTIQGGLAKGKSYDVEEKTVELPYLRVANVQNGHFNLDVVHMVEVAEKEVDRYTLKPGDVLMNEGGDNDKLGRGAVWNAELSPCLHQNHVFSIRPERGLSSEWLATFTQSASARAFFYLHSKQSTNLASISSSNVMSCWVPMPPEDEQVDILERLKETTTNIDEMTQASEKGIELLGERRSALISAAVTGKIDVRGWQPSMSIRPGPELQSADASAVNG